MSAVQRSAKSGKWAQLAWIILSLEGWIPSCMPMLYQLGMGRFIRSFMVGVSSGIQSVWIGSSNSQDTYLQINYAYLFLRL